MPGILSDVLTIAHQDVTVTVCALYNAVQTPLESIKGYLFSSGGAYQSISATTDARGRATFNLPQKDYKVRADYLGGQYWSQVFNGQDASVDIAHGYADVHVTEFGADIYDTPVYLFTGAGAYFGRVKRTDSVGMARFLIPARAYKFRVDYNGRQYWSEVVNILADEETAVDLQLDLLALNLTNDPNPVRFDGNPPVYEPEPIRLASLFDISGILARSVVAQIPEEKIYYYINDHLGTPRKMVDESGAVVWSADYRPFGEVNVTANAVGNAFRFPGQYYDAETGFHYNYHRYYDPKTGRYLTPDPIGLVGGLNFYSYVLGNPFNLIDPFGLDDSDIIGALSEVGIRIAEWGGLIAGGTATALSTASVAAGVVLFPREVYPDDVLLRLVNFEQQLKKYEEESRQFCKDMQAVKDQWESEYKMYWDVISGRADSVSLGILKKYPEIWDHLDNLGRKEWPSNRQNRIDPFQIPVAFRNP